jgi:hypothetical protein
MSRKKHQRQSNGPHVQVPKSIMATPAWRAMSPEARLVWIELRGWLRNDRLNNGKVHLSCRKAAVAIGVNKDTIARCFTELEHFGFLHKTRPGFLGSDGRGIAAEYRFTDLAHGTHAATRDYEKWDGELFAYKPHRPTRKKQNPVLSGRTPRIVRSDTRKSSNGSSVCIVRSDTGEAPRCPVRSDTSRLPPPAVAAGQDQGSSTARAPVQAGGAGSSPAPDAKDASRHSHEAIMNLVAGVVDEQLDAIEAQL